MNRAGQCYGVKMERIAFSVMAWKRGNDDAGILLECKKCLPKNRPEVACLANIVVQRYKDIVGHIFIFEYLDMFNIF
jgi:hypothetical protein